MTEPERLLQVDVRATIERLGKEAWISAYVRCRSGDDAAIFSAIVPRGCVTQALQSDSWDLRIGGGLPDCSQSFPDGRTETTYRRFGNSWGVEPLIFVRTFAGLKPDYVELSEEFRHFHNLFHDRATDKYLRFDGMGNEELVAEIDPEGRCRILLRPLREFLALKDACVAIYFDVVRYSKLPIDEIPEAERQVDIREADATFSLRVSECDWRRDEGVRSFSWLLGKKIIEPLPREESGIWPYDDGPKKSVAFIIGIDANGKPIEHPCDPQGLANHFGKNAGAPHFLTPVFFRMEVLAKYYAQPDKFEVQDGYLSCGHLWGLRLDNDHHEFVVVYLGDLGETLSYDEQMYWRSFNVPPRGSISAVAYKRGFWPKRRTLSGPTCTSSWRWNASSRRGRSGSAGPCSSPCRGTTRIISRRCAFR